MSLVVADTTPLRFLVEIAYEHVLQQLFRQVCIPDAVARELRHARTPAMVRQWAEELPSWVEVREIGVPVFAHELAGLDRGEWEAIELAKQIHANLPLIGYPLDSTNRQEEVLWCGRPRPAADPLVDHRQADDGIRRGPRGPPGSARGISKPTPGLAERGRQIPDDHRRVCL
ncbi:MAG: hypothetical protein ABI165_17625 [Bryobacteraceae bacterium]